MSFDGVDNKNAHPLPLLLVLDRDQKNYPLVFMLIKQIDMKLDRYSTHRKITQILCLQRFKYAIV